MTDMSWLPTDDTPLDDAAIAYAEHGFRVIPLWWIRPDGSCACGAAKCKPEVSRKTGKLTSSAGKHPIGRVWQKSASTDPDAVRDARRGKPHANVGLAMGGEGRLVAVDIDGDEGFASLAEIEANVRPWPVTLTSRSGREDVGEHRLYRVPPHLDMARLGNRAGARWPGIDTRVENGQIVVAPSVHFSGRRYSWSVRAPIAEMPEWLFEALAVDLPSPTQRRDVPPPTSSAPRAPSTPGDYVTPYMRAVVENACREIATCSEGGRNQLLFAKSCTVFEYHVGEGRDHLGAWADLAAAGVACGLPAPEVSAVLSKAWRKAQSSPPRRVPPPTHNAPPPSSSSAPPSNGYEGWKDEPATSSSSDSTWESSLAVDGKGYVKNTFGNVCKILRNASQYVGRLAFNQMRIVPFIDGRPLRDADVGRFREEIEARWGLAPSRDAMVQAINLIAEERSFHPVQDYLRGLKWDGEKRIGSVAARVLGITGQPLADRMLRAWFVSAVARALSPGCKVDTTLVLVGPQGFKKSTFFATLGGEWFSDSYADVRTKDGVLQVHAAWIYEWAEIDRVTTKRDASDVKAFLTIARDDVRPPYGIGILNQPRSSVIVGTTNPKPFLDDETGSRRFWPLTVRRRVDIELLREWRDQLWAEAVEAYRAGEDWWLTQAEEAQREDVAAEHSLDDAWIEPISAYVAHPLRMTSGVTTADVLAGALAMDIGRATRADETHVGKVLRFLKWTAKQETRNGARIRVYRPAPAQPATDVVQGGCAAESTTQSTRSQPAQPAQRDLSCVEMKNVEGDMCLPEMSKTGRAGCAVVQSTADEDDGQHAFSDLLEGE